MGEIEVLLLDKQADISPLLCIPNLLIYYDGKIYKGLTRELLKTIKKDQQNYINNAVPFAVGVLLDTEKNSEQWQNPLENFSEFVRIAFS